MTYNEFVATLDKWGNAKIPFFFLVDFEMQKPQAFPLRQLPNDIFFDFPGVTNTFFQQSSESGTIDLNISPLSVEAFKAKFEAVMHSLMYGDSYLTNLTLKTPIKANSSLKEIFLASKALFRLYWKNQFVVFSPERFVRIQDGRIFSYPMKGTIDAAIPDAPQLILDSQKELAEHVTIVDLIRNDLSRIADSVKVNRFRYIDLIRSERGELIQVSSEIEGTLRNSLQYSFGTILNGLLPAGSISGAPKDKTIEIIRKAEGEPRGYYTGVAGVFDGRIFESTVLIRYIENVNGDLYYRSGGGITTQSEMLKEYQEVLDKIYVPVN